MLADRTKTHVFSDTLDELAVNSLKLVGVEMVTRAASGHPGVVVSLATALHTLVTRHLYYDPANPKLLNRDRLIFSGGHASGLVYAYLHSLDLISFEEIENFRQLNFHTSGHPELSLKRGVEATTGPLGQGVANGVGLALARAHLNAKFPEFDHYVYVFCGDGDLQEGVAWEAMSFAGTNKLKKLIVLYDSNDVQLDTKTDVVVREDLKKRCEGVGWTYYRCRNSISEIDEALQKAKLSEQPVLIEVKTVIGEGLAKQGTTAVHGSPPSKEEFQNFKTLLGLQHLSTLEIPKEVKDYFQQCLASRRTTTFSLSEAFLAFLNQSPENLKFDLKFQPNSATRVTSQVVNDYVSNNLSTWIGGSADLSVSTKIYGQDGAFSPTNPLGRNLLFGVREAAMAAVANGIALHSNLRPFVSTFLVFVDYLKPALRLSALMDIPVTYVFSHDSVFVGEDGPTHQPIEQLASLRATPNVSVLRPADEKETVGAFKVALKRSGPTVVVTSRQNLPSLLQTSVEDFTQGFYFLQEADTPWSIISTGSELSLALEVGQALGINVISASNWTFPQHPLSLPEFTFSLEAASTFGWQKFAKYNFGIDVFGLSGPGEAVYQYFGFTKENLISRFRAVMESKGG